MDLNFDKSDNEALTIVTPIVLDGIWRSCWEPIKSKDADAIYCSTTTGADNALLEDEISKLKITAVDTGDDKRKWRQSQQVWFVLPLQELSRQQCIVGHDRWEWGHGARSRTKTDYKRVAKYEKSFSRPGRRSMIQWSGQSHQKSKIAISVFDCNDVLLWPSPYDEAIKWFVSTSLREKVMCLANYIGLTGHSPERWMYNTMHQQYYWLHITNKVYVTVR